MRVSYIGAVLNASGYSDSARNNVMALLEVSVPLEVIPLNFENFKSDLGQIEQQIRPLITAKPSGNIQIIHCIPSLFPKFIRGDAYNIGYTAWETSRLSDNWVECINGLNEVWVPSIYNYNVFKESGVKIPVYVIPHTFNRQLFEAETEDIPLHGHNKEDYLFYSIFQYHERKDPLALLKAYLTEFTIDENVALVLKTYLFDPNNKEERNKIKSDILKVKEKLRLKASPKMLFIGDLLSKPRINSLHRYCDCYVSTHRSEGFGIPLAEAMMAGNPVIATDYSGSKDFLSDKTGFPVKYQLTPVYNMPWDNYYGNQVWADIDIMDLRERMRYVFEHRKEAEAIGEKGQEFVDKNLSWSQIGNLMRSRILDIRASMGT